MERDKWFLEAKIELWCKNTGVFSEKYNFVEKIFSKRPFLGKCGAFEAVFSFF